MTHQIEEHKILKTFALPFGSRARPRETTQTQWTEQLLNEHSAQGWRVVTAVTEFDFLLAKAVK